MIIVVLYCTFNYIYFVIIYYLFCNNNIHCFKCICIICMCMLNVNKCFIIISSIWKA